MLRRCGIACPIASRDLVDVTIGPMAFQKLDGKQDDVSVHGIDLQ
ncbi:hypothetical protein C731_4558 [Mycolicibacterium hassiacum DSM 44199]|uniref:Uncharacterized protein n=1 Tax=Mycolicibacterium hassiacum (strain DSM 44199 / CIP 105218 / JCM 12690 / 3849) TaxID=1122247 RepID=K5BIK2_MYCHD|nr:hypothetical protein C731_4558 [Mycolicibacterium hassiacum DSM 44199]